MTVNSYMCVSTESIQKKKKIEFPQSIWYNCKYQKRKKRYILYYNARQIRFYVLSINILFIKTH